MKSFYRIFGSGTKLWSLEKYIQYSTDVIAKSLRKQVRDILELQENELKKSMDIVLSFTLCTICSNIAEYLELHGQSRPICAIRYEDLIKDPQYALEALFKYLELPLDLVPKGMEAMKKDSQKGTNISRKSTKSGINLGEYTGKNKRLVEAIFKAYGIPNSDDLIDLPGTISHK